LNPRGWAPGDPENRERKTETLNVAILADARAGHDQRGSPESAPARCSSPSRKTRFTLPVTLEPDAARGRRSWRL